MNTTTRMMLGCMALLLSLAQPLSAASDVSVTLSVDADGIWQVDYTFDQPVKEIDFGAGLPGYRDAAWQVLSPSAVTLTDAGLLSSAAPSKTFSIRIQPYFAYPPGHYVPMARFSDGGRSVYTGYLLPDLPIPAESCQQASNCLMTPTTRVQISTREGQNGLLSPATRSGRPGFAYVGPNSGHNDWGFADVILDPAMPAWIARQYRAVLEQTSALYSKKMPAQIPNRPLILVAAGDLDAIDGYSIKGGALADQIMFTLRGTDLNNPTPSFVADMQKLMAHELAHLWQTGLTTQSVDTTDPWIHEGAADALAIQALRETGIWSEQQVQEFVASRAHACEQSTTDSSLRAVAEAGNYDAIYSCGLTRFWEQPLSVFDLWAAIDQAAMNTGQGYSQTLFDQQLAALQAAH